MSLSLSTVMIQAFTLEPVSVLLIGNGDGDDLSDGHDLGVAEGNDGGLLDLVVRILPQF